MHRINPGGSGEEANEPVFTDSGLGALGFRVPTSADDLLSDVVSGAWISCGLFAMA